MRKILKSTLAVCLLLCMAFGLAACGNTGLKAEDLVGHYQLVHLTYTASAENTAGYQSCEYTKEQYLVLEAKIDAGEATQKEENDYYAMAGNWDGYMDVREDGTVYDVYETSPELFVGNWEIKDGELVYTQTLNSIDTYTAEYKDGQIIVTWINNRDSDPWQGTTVYVYEKVVRA